MAAIQSPTSPHLASALLPVVTASLSADMDEKHPFHEEITSFDLEPEPTSSTKEHSGIYPYTIVSTDQKALKFAAAASSQLRLPGRGPSPSELSDLLASARTEGDISPKDAGHLLVSSPYTAPAHLLDLRTLDFSNASMAKALTVLRPTRTDYATAPYNQSYNWTDVVRTLRHLHHISPASDITPSRSGSRESFYVIIFRSSLPVSPSDDQTSFAARKAQLAHLDALAHREAIASGGLLKYWFGESNVASDGANLATCLWRARSDAILGGKGPGHAQAMRVTAGLYKYWKVERKRFWVDVKGEGGEDEEGGWGFEPWTDD